MKNMTKIKLPNLRHAGIGLGLIAALLVLLYSFTEPPRAPNEEEKNATVKLENCLNDACTGRVGLADDQAIFGSFLPAKPVSGTYVRPTITENGRTASSTGWVHYTDFEHAYKISFYDTGFDPSFFIHFYPSDSEKIDETGCVTTGADGLEEPEGLAGDGRIYRDETSSPRSYAIQDTSWCQTTLRRVDWHKTSGDFFEVFSTPVRDGTIVVYATIPGSGWLKCEDTSFHPAVYNNIQTQETCETYNAKAMARVQEAHMHPELITSGGFTDVGWISGGTLKELLETFTRI